MASPVLLDLDNTLVHRVQAFRGWAAGFLSARDLERDDVPGAVAQILFADGEA